MQLSARIAAAFAAATLALAAFSAPAGAQIKPLDVEKDPNGVDLLSGQATPRTPELSLPAAGNLRFKRISDLVPVLNGTLIPNTFGKATYDISGNGATSDHFDCDDQAVCRTKKKNGSGIVPDLGSKQFSYYEGGSGTAINFDLQNGSQGALVAGSGFSFSPSSVTYANGETLTYNYDQYSTTSGTVWRRPASVVSNLGYTLLLTWQNNTYGQAGYFTLTQAAIYKSSDLAIPLARLSYSGSTVTDLLGRQYSCTNCLTFSATTSTTLRLPGETVDTFATEAQPRTYGSVTHSNWVTKVTTDGVDWNYSYVATGGFQNQISQATVTAPLGFSRTITIDRPGGGSARPRIASIVNSQSGTTSYQYDNDVRVTRITYPEGNAAGVGYDQRGNVIESRQIAKPGSGQADLVETAYYGTVMDDDGCYYVTCFKPQWTRDAKGQQTDYTWAGEVFATKLEPADQNGQRRKTINTLDGNQRVIREEVCATDAAGNNLTCGTAAASAKLTTYWGGTGLPLTETVADGTGGGGLTTTYSYDNAGRLLSKDPPLAGSDDATYYRYDVVGRRTWEIGPKGANGYRTATRTTYRDADDQVLKVETGSVTSETDPNLSVLQQTNTTYDSRRLATTASMSPAAGGAQTLTQTSYDARNQPECVAVRMNVAAYGSLPASACSLGTPGSFGPDRITRSVYDSEGRVWKEQRAYAQPLQQDYATYTYSANGKRTSVTDANGNKASMSYDGFDRQSAWNFPSPTTPGQVSTTDYEAYGYDANGNRISLRKRDGRSIVFGYDARNQLLSKTYPNGGARGVYYSYDIRGLQTAARYDSVSGADAVLSSWDVFGRQTGSTTAMGGTSRTLTYTYNASGARLTMTWPDGNHVYTFREANGALYYSDINSAVPLIYPQYDQYGRAAVTSRWVGGWTVPTTYGYDGISRPASLAHGIAGGGFSATFGYNPASQITTLSRSNDAYAWPGYVNVNRSYAANGLNQYTTAGPAAFGYDANGNLTSDGTRSYGYDIENRLVSASGGLQLDYDPTGRLWRTSGGASGTTQFLYDGDALVAEYDGAGNMLNRYVHGDGDDDPQVWYQGSGVASPRYLYADHQGSIVAVADASGNTLAINSYDEYGITRNTASAAIAPYSRFGYTGQAWLPDLGMYHYKARVYSPTLGRFLQTDPIGYDDQINLYAYVGNDPVNKRDPSGKECVANGKSVTCSIKLVRPFADMNKKEQAEAIRKLRNYTVAAARAQAMASQNKSITVPASRGFPGFKVPASQVRDNLFRKPVVISSQDGAPRNASSNFRTITLFRNIERRSNEGQVQTLLHEGTHWTPAEIEASSKFGQALGRMYEHDQSYDDVAEQFGSDSPALSGPRLRRPD